MALINCPECGKQVSDTAPSCIHCGYQPLLRPQPPAPTSIINWRKSIRIWSLLIIAVVVILAWGKACNYMTNESAQAEADTIATNPKQLTEGELESISQNIEGGKSIKELGKVGSKQIATVQDKYKYEFRSIKSYGQHKCVIYIRLRGQLGKLELEEIAKQVRKEHSTYQSLLIFYLLPGTDIADGAYATSHYDNELEVKIIGVPVGEEEKPKKGVEASSKIVGEWYCNTPGVKHTITIFKDGNRLKAKQVFPFGYEDIETLKESKNGRYYKINNNFGEYYILKSTGILELWDRDGRFGVAVKR